MYNKQTWLDEIPDMTKPIYDASGKQKTDPQTGRPLFELVQVGTRITSNRLNTMEGGIEVAHTLVEQLAKELGGNFVASINGTMGLQGSAQGLKASWTSGVAYVGGRRYQVAAGEMPLNQTQGQYLYVDTDGVVKKTSSQATAKAGLLFFYVATDTSGVISFEDRRVNISLEEILKKVDNIKISDASLTQKGIVQLSDAINSPVTDRAATPNAVKTAYDKAAAAQQVKLTQDNGKVHEDGRYTQIDSMVDPGFYFVAMVGGIPDSNGLLQVYADASETIYQHYTSERGSVQYRVKTWAGWSAWTVLAKDDPASAGGFGVTTYSGNTYSVTTADGRPSSLSPGSRVTIKVNATNTSSGSTLNVNRLGAKTIKKVDGTAVPSSFFKAGSIYTLVYDGTSAFILQGEGGDISYGDRISASQLTEPILKVTQQYVYTDSSQTGIGMGIGVDALGNVYCVYNNSDTAATNVRKLTEGFTLVWGIANTPAAWNVAVDPAGNICVALNTGTKAVRKYNTSGVEIASNSDVGSATNIAIDSAGNMYVSHFSGVGVRKLTPSGVEVWRSTAPTSAYAVAVDIYGNVYVGYGSDGVRKLDPSGVQLWQNKDVTSRIEGIDTDRFENCYVAGGGIRKLNKAGTPVWTRTDLTSAEGIKVDKDLNVYAVFNGSSGSTAKTTRRLDGAGAGADVWSNGAVSGAREMAIDAYGGVYIATASSGMVKLTQSIDSYKIVN